MASRRMVRIVVPATDAEIAADALWAGSPSAVVAESLDDGSVRLSADVVDPDRVDPRWPAEVLEVPEDAGLDAWREHAAPVRIGGRVVLQPAWLPAPPDDADVVVLLDPGHAFGSGSHPSTRLAVASLEEQLGGGERVLDVGCGSGVLSIAACLLGAARATAIDIDPVAVEAARANAALNGLGERVSVGRLAPTDLTGTFDVVVANIGASVLRALRDDLLARARPGAVVVLAGFLDGQADDVADAYDGCSELDRRSEDGWTALTLLSQARQQASQ